MSIDFEKIENDVMNIILNDNSEDGIIMMKQYINRLSKTREINPCGWFTFFHIPNNSEKISKRDELHIGNVIVPMVGMEYGIGFVLHVSDGQINTLEAYTFEEYLPQP